VLNPAVYPEDEEFFQKKTAHFLWSAPFLFSGGYFL